MSCGPRHMVLTPGRSSSGSCILGGGRAGAASVSSGVYTVGGIGNGQRANFSGRSHAGAAPTCAFGGGRNHFSSGSCSGAFVGGGHMAGNGFGAGSHIGSPAARSVVGGAGAGHATVVGGIPGGMVSGAHGGVPANVVGGMGSAVGGAHAGMVGGPCGVVGAVPAGMVGGMGGVMSGGHGGMVGGMGGMVTGPVMVSGMGNDPAVCGGVFSNFDGKMTMQNLNDRLASYLDKVRCLEEENADLECRIREFYAKQGPLTEPKDYSHYHQQIEDLKNQLICTSVENNKLLLCIDNSKLTADDFRTKYETECCLRQNVEADINGLHQILDQLTACRADLDVQCENLHDELCCLKKNHVEEVTCLKKQSTGDVNVEVNTCPGPDLKKILEEMRCKYEAMIEGNRKEVESWYESKIEEVNRDVCNSSQEIEESNNKVTELRRQLQALQIDYEAQCSLRDTLESSLGETELRYNNHLGELQERISRLEQQLAELRSEMECQNHDYTELLDVKSRLEQEIATYRGLLEGSQHEVTGGGGSPTRVSGVSGGRSGETRSSHTYVTHSSGHSAGHTQHGGHLHH
ncbi:keratin, type I cytoskeletal 19-like isoform X2 [Sceloporus undulatus]|uniref:keratin, type I cytoskeletal 19-like isoform X2 n=1 Tax=Sceloporus undulatus TaxID=8520 RepID=UPI001C4D562B|nr:keratin, type I cytoskeletal 19-like isoform X2 [Sceloporus undulatus]